jgi:oxygen-independent coproporphyrinogen-3 oxidase
MTSFRAQELTPEPGTALYVHLPFCVAKCTYCDFYSLAAEGEDLDGTLEAVIAEVHRRAPRSPRTVFVGGGTPSLYPPEDLSRLFDELDRASGFRASAREVTLESNPESLDADKVRALRSFGVDRLSIGVQSLDPTILELFGRVHTAETALAALDAARTGGIERISADLIYGAPGQTVEAWLTDLRRVTAFELGHISAYQLAYEKGTIMTRWREEGRLPVLGEELELAFFEATHGALGDQGYQAYEVSNFCLSGQQCQHNEGYWRNEPYVGIGPSAVSQVGGTRFGNPRSLHPWRRAIERGDYPTAWEETLSPLERLGETWWLGLRTRRGVDQEAARASASVEPAKDPTLPRIEEMMHRGLLERVGVHYRLTERGWPLADAVARKFLDATSEREKPTDPWEPAKTVGPAPSDR